MTPSKPEGDENKSQTLSNGGVTIGKNEKKISWSEENETILVEWCDIAQCYKWLYTRSHSQYATMHAWFTIPTIILSTISGTASFAQASLPSEYQNYATLGIGTLNILIGICATIQQYLKISELNESHRVSSISWDKFARNIRIELAKSPDERSDAGSFIKICRQEFDRLMETSPRIPDKTVAEFIVKFRGNTEEERNRFKDLKKPDICDTITTVNETRHKWYLDEQTKSECVQTDMPIERTYSFGSISDNNDIKNDFSNVMLTRLKDIRQKKDAGTPLENILKTQEDFDKGTLANIKQYEENERERVKNEQLSKIKEYIDRFNNLYERVPIKDEIVEALKNEIDKDIINKYYDQLVAGKS
jgi:DNA-binding transcriptional MerR regulator